MRVAVIGTATSDWSPAPVWRRSATTWSAWTTTRRRSRSSARAGSRSTSPPGGPGGQTRRAGPAALHDRRGRGGPGRRGDLHLREHPAPPGRRGGSQLRRAGDAPDRRARHQDTLLVEKSTVPVQTGQWIQKTLARYAKRPGLTFDVASNPEFTREGMAVEDFLHPDRLVPRRGQPPGGGAPPRPLRPHRGGRFACPVHPDCRVDRPCRSS